MVRLTREIEIKTYGEYKTIVQEIKQFHYSSEEERNTHKAKMESEGYEDSGQIKENLGSIEKPNHVWYSSYTKCTTIPVK